MSKETFRERLARELKNDRSPEDAYQAAAKAVVKDELIRHFAPVGIQEAYHLRRNASRSVENRAFGGWGGRLTPVKQESRPPMNIREMLEGEVFYGSEAWVTWAEATVDDHEARIEAQARHIAAVERDAERHRRAVKVLREHDADSLDEIEDWSDLRIDDQDDPESSDQGE